ncbi:thermonuclease family protein [Herbaspirillum sp. HC18]|nr:thermonuclease family protein [Herbaspirillum sp. HC18]
MINRLVTLLVLLIAAPSWADTYKVVGITDGDTIKVLSASLQQVKCRLYGIDAPEKSQAFGEASKQSLSELIYLRTVDIQIVDQDRYGRSICRVTSNGMDVNREQIARGMAWMYRRYTRDAQYSQAEAHAKANHIGLWRDAAPTPPWEFRRGGR